jgi:hypothetical protein
MNRSALDKSSDPHDQTDAAIAKGAMISVANLRR